MDDLLISIAAQRQRLDELRPLSGARLADLEHDYDIKLTYTSNAIEGNKLSPVETTLVIEKGSPSDRLDYIRSLQEAQAGQGSESFNALLYKRLEATLGEYLSALQEGTV